MAKISNFLKHPLFLLLAGTLAGSYIIPRINSESSRSNLLQQRKIVVATDIVENNSKVHRLISALGTNLEMFHKHTDEEHYKQDIQELNQHMHKDMQEFNQFAWWWFWKIAQEATITRLTNTKDMNDIKTNLHKYSKNLNESSEVIEKFWITVSSPNYNPGDPKVTSSMIDTRKILIEKQKERDLLVSLIIQKFAVDEKN